MYNTIEIEGKAVEVFISSEADEVLSHRSLPLAVEMELIFSCLLCKKVRFSVAGPNDAPSVCINDRLSIRFRPVTLQECSKVEASHKHLVDFPLVNKRPYIPKWLMIDFRFGHWFGEFGYLEHCA